MADLGQIKNQFDSDPVAISVKKALDKISDTLELAKNGDLARGTYDKVFSEFVLRVFDYDWVRKIEYGGPRNSLTLFQNKVKNRYDEKDLTLLRELRRKSSSPPATPGTPSGKPSRRTQHRRDAQKIRQVDSNKSSAPASPNVRSSFAHSKATPSTSSSPAPSQINNSKSQPSTSSASVASNEKKSQAATQKPTSSVKRTVGPPRQPALAQSNYKTKVTEILQSGSSSSSSSRDTSVELARKARDETDKSKKSNIDIGSGVAPSVDTKTDIQRVKDMILKNTRIVHVLNIPAQFDLPKIQDMLDTYISGKSDKQDRVEFTRTAFVRQHRFDRRSKKMDIRIHCNTDELAQKLRDNGEHWCAELLKARAKIEKSPLLKNPRPFRIQLTGNNYRIKDPELRSARSAPSSSSSSTN
jgi:hypothetical protein